MQIKTFHIKIKDGKIVFKSDYHKELLTKWIAQFPDGDYLLEIDSKKENRSIEQNRYYWFYLGLIAEETGYTPDDLHQYYKGKFLTKKILKMFGQDVRIEESTTKQSKGQFCDYLANIMVDSSIPLPDTTEFYGYSYHK